VPIGLDDKRVTRPSQKVNRPNAKMRAKTPIFPDQFPILPDDQEHSQKFSPGLQLMIFKIPNLILMFLT
jgi:hypothetical protein